jgi:excisionase family DNA binding protein
MSETGAREYAPKPTYTIPEAAKILGIGRNQMYQAVRAGQVKVVTINGRDRVVGAWLEKQLRAD